MRARVFRYWVGTSFLTVSLKSFLVSSIIETSGPIQIAAIAGTFSILRLLLEKNEILQQSALIPLVSRGKKHARAVLSRIREVQSH